MSEDIRTYRGRSLAEILPRIKEELGDEAVVLRRREGLAGGVGGFFAKAFIEVEARSGGPRLDVRDDEPAEPGSAARDEEPFAPRHAAPAPPQRVSLPAAELPAPPQRMSLPAAELPAPPQRMSFPAAALPEPVAAAGALTAAAEAASAPSGFARLLADAYAGGFEAAPASAEAAPPAAAEPEPFVADFAPREAEAAPQVPDRIPADMERQTMPALAAQENHASADAAAGLPLPPAAPLPRAAATAQARLIEGGVSAALAAELAAEAVMHGLPFASPRSVNRLAREALVRRIPHPAPRGDRAVVAFVGPAGAGRTTVAGGLAAAYAAASDVEVRAIALRAADGGSELAGLAGAERTAHAPTGAHAAAIAADAGSRALIVVDVGPVRPRDEAGVRTVRRDLRAAGVTEVHIVLPATTSAAAARAALEAVRPLKPAGIVLTHADEAPAGAVLELAAAERLPLTWQSTAVAVAPADVLTLTLEIL